MHNTPLEHEITRLYEDSSLPSDNGDAQKDYLWLSNLSLQNRTDEFEQLLNTVYQGSLGSRSRISDKERHKKHCELILLNLSRAALCHRWVLISRTTNDYSNDYYYKLMGLSYRHVIDILDYLEESQLITSKRGAVYEAQPLRTRIYPNQELSKQLYQVALSTEEAFNTPYTTISQAEGGYQEVIVNLDKDHPDRQRMHLVNEFLQYQSWALKAPVTLKYKHNIITGGRLYTSFQNLPARSYQIRQNTLINDKPICEVDFNANHLRINLAVMAGEDAGESPYEDIMVLADIDSRDKIKSFITIAMGADDRGKAMNASSLHGMSGKQFEAIEAATLKRFPRLRLFDGFGVNAQSLEGQILLDVMVEGAKEGIAVLPIHDACAVNTEHASWCNELMLDKWQEYVCTSILSGKPWARTKS